MYFIGPSFPSLCSDPYLGDLGRGENEGIGGASQKKKNRGGLHD